MATKKVSSKKGKVLQRSRGINRFQLLLFVLAFVVVGIVIIRQSYAAGSGVDSVKTDVTFAAYDGTWPTAVLSDPMSLAMHRYNSDYGYPGELQYGPVLTLKGTASGLKTNLFADAYMTCGHNEPIPLFTYDSVAKNYGLAETGNTMMGLKGARLQNGYNDLKFYVSGAAVDKIDPTKPMICNAQVIVTNHSGNKQTFTTAVPITQKFILQPK